MVFVGTEMCKWFDDEFFVCAISLRIVFVMLISSFFFSTHSLIRSFARSLSASRCIYLAIYKFAIYDLPFLWISFLSIFFFLFSFFWMLCECSLYSAIMDGFRVGSNCGIIACYAHCTKGRANPTHNFILAWVLWIICWFTQSAFTTMLIYYSSVVVLLYIKLKTHNQT